MAPSRALTLVLFALAACATVPAGPPPPPPELSFRGVKAVALVHRLDLGLGTPGPGDARRRDPLDALQRALAARGVKTVTVELPERPPPELDAIEEAARLAETSAQEARAGLGGPAVATLGERAAPALDQLGADAFAVYARGGGWGMPASPPPRFGSAWSMAPPPPPPVSAISVVARNGTVVTFAWGGGAEPFSGGLANAAEAVDAALALLLQPPPE